MESDRKKYKEGVLQGACEKQTERLFDAQISAKQGNL